MPCYICNVPFGPAQMARIDGDGNANKRDLAIRRRDKNDHPPLAVTNITRICINCNRSVLDEIAAIQRDPACSRLNVLKQVANHSCVICHVDHNTHRLSVECRVKAFVLMDIYVPPNVRSCPHHLDENGFFLQVLLPGLQSINRPYVIRGKELQIFLQQLRNMAINQERYENENCFSDNEFQSITPITKEQFCELFTFCD